MKPSLEFIVGFIVGLAIVLGLTAALFLMAKAKVGSAKFDERQQALRGQAYRTAFWSLVGYLGLAAALDVLGVRWAESAVLLFVGVCFAVTVFVIQCVFTDAYFAVNQRPGRYMLLFAGMCVLNTLCVVYTVLMGERLTTGGLLNYHAINAVIVGMFLLMFLSLALKTWLERRRGGAET